MTEILPQESIVTVFRSRLRADVGAEYTDLALEMERLARSTPGFVDFKSFRADDGERVSIVVFADRASHEAWRRHEAHRRAQRAGRDRFYEWYAIVVCGVLDQRGFERPE